uniref:Ionotropic glutamate receptor C-terminal domain-containing protein n=1 Tax=Timema monikensis TaxID=170555 RepID=A0A7R9HMT6_9NEOP|nr:unnamed protein product [Timema monikensis]
MVRWVHCANCIEWYGGFTARIVSNGTLVVVQEEECTNCPSRLTEWYRTTKNSLLLSNDIGTWSAVTRHLVLDYKNVWLRRTDLDGLNLKVAVQQGLADCTPAYSRIQENMCFKVIAVLPIDLDDHWQSFVKPFSIHLWLAIVATLVLMPVVLALSYITGRRTDFELTEGPHLFNIREAYIVTYGAFLQQSSENDPKSPSARLVFWLAFILGVVLYTAYSAALISKLTVQKTEYPFLTTEEMLRSGYKLNVVRGHYTLTVLQNMAAGPLAQVYRKHLHGNPRALVDDIEAGLMRVSRNSKIAFLDILERTEAILGKRRCSLLAIPTDFIRTHATLVVRKRMPYKKAFDY